MRPKAKGDRERLTRLSRRNPRCWWSKPAIFATAVSLGLFGAISWLVPPAAAQSANPRSLPGAELLAALRAGGYVLYFRHADTDHSREDQRPVNLDDCATQRVLSEKGRRNSRAIGEAIHTLDVPIGSVLASPLCRTVETGVLAFGYAEKSMAAREAGPQSAGKLGTICRVARAAVDGTHRGQEHGDHRPRLSVLRAHPQGTDAGRGGGGDRAAVRHELRGGRAARPEGVA
jgi:phosphohistidine phosphatase SixA